ncbi:MAG: hypothetical protein AAFN10_27695, partial [Bacteroidota bacterium]
ESEPVQSADSLDTPPAVYLAIEPKEPLKSLDLEENKEPEVRLPETSQVPAITTESSPEIFIPLPKVEEIPAAPIAAVEIENPQTEYAGEDLEELEDSAAKSISGPSVSEAEVIPDPPIAAVASDEDIEILLPGESDETIAEETVTEEAIAEETLEALKTEAIDPIETEVLAESVVAKEDEYLSQLEAEIEEADLAVQTEIAAQEEPVIPTSRGAQSSLEQIVKQTQADPTLIPGIHIAALPMTPPPAREEDQTRAQKVNYTGGSIVEYFDAMQSNALNQAVAESERMYGTKSQSSLPKSWHFPNNPALTPQMEGRLLQSQEMFENYYVPRLKWQTEAPVAFMLRRIDKDPNYRSIEIIKHWSAVHYEALIPELILRITYTEIVGLKNYKDIIIWDRVDSGDMVLDGPGAEIKDDLFAVAGRANYLLKNLTGEDFGDIGLNTSVEERLFIRDQWVNWLLNLENGQSFVSP